MSNIEWVMLGILVGLAIALAIELLMGTSLIKLLSKMIEIKKIKWLIQRYRQMAVDERATMLSLHQKGYIEAMELSIKEVAKWMVKEQVLMEKLEEL